MRSWRSVYSMVAIAIVAGPACSGDDTVILFRAAPFG